MLASTWFDPVLGVDIHIVLVPSPVGPIPTPLPHPFIGMVFDPMGMVVGAAISTAMGAGPTMTMVNSMPATNCGTAVMAMPPHLPMPPGVAHPKPPDNDAELFFGGLQGGVQGSFGVRLGDIALSCGDPVRLPTSVVLAIPKGAPVLNMKPMAPDLMAIAMTGAMKAAMKGLGAAGKAMRALQRSQGAFGKAMRRASNALKNKLDGVTPKRARGMKDRAVCFVTGHPVDVATGRMFTEFTDLELPGPLPLSFERAYDSSFSWRGGAMGRGWSHSFESSAWVEPGKVVLKWEDGRELEFSTLDMKDRVMREGQSMFDPIYRMTLKCTGPLRFEVQEISGVVHKYEPVPGGDPNIAQRVQKRDRSGFHLLEYHYDKQGRVEWIRDCGGRLVGLEYDKQGRLGALKVPLAKGHGHRIHRRFFYSKEGDLTRVEDSLGHSWHFDYADHLMVQETDRTGLSFYFQYDRYGAGAKCVRTWGNGGIYDHVISYMPDGKKTIVEDSLGGVTVYEMDELGQVVAVTDALGAKTKYAYDEVTGQSTIQEDALGRATAMTYDERGNLLSATAGDGSTVSWEYDLRFNAPSRFIDPLGSHWGFRYDDRGQLIHRRSPDAQRLSYRWEGGLLKSVRDETGREVTFEFDERRELAKSTDPTGATKEYRYDGLGRLTKLRDATGMVTRVLYDTDGRPTRLERPLQPTQTRKHDREGNISEIVEGRRRVQLGYGGFNRLAWREEAGARVSFKYDTEERLVALQNEAGDHYALERDAVGRIRQEIGFDKLTRTYAYDMVGQMVEVLTPEGRATTHVYDELGRLIEIAYPDGTQSKMTYRADGALMRAESAEAVVEFDRDLLGRVLRETQDGGHTWVTSSYAVSGGREWVRSSLGAHQQIERGRRGEVMGLTQQAGESTRSIRFERDIAGRERARELPGGVEIQWKRDAIGRPLERVLKRGASAGGFGTGDDQRTLSTLRYQWGSLFELEAIFDDDRGGRWFTHDDRGRLVAERRGRAAAGDPTQPGLEATALDRAMDAVGNVFQRTDQGDRVYAGGGRLEQANGTKYRYGPEGERIEKLLPDGSAWRYAYDGMGRLAEVQRPDGELVRFAYDALGRRVRKQALEVDDVGQETMRAQVQYVWDGNTVLHEARTIVDGKPQTADDITTWYWEPESWSPVGKAQGNTHQCIHSDHLGTPTEMTDDVGELAWKMQLDAFGVPEMERGEREDCPWRWPGQYEDAETGLYYNNQRYYDPESGQYIRQDPIGLRGGLHLYAYVDDVTTWVDPWGLSKYCVSTSRRTHILEGDGPGTGTGHGPGRGNVQGAFPDTWTDDQAIAAIERVANSPKSTWRQSTGPGYDTAPITRGGPDPGAPVVTSRGTPVRHEVRGRDHGQDITVIVEPGGEGIITGYTYP